MICPNCGMQLPDDSEFCQYCGSKISVPVEKADPAMTSVAPAQNSEPKSMPIVNISEAVEAEQTGNSDKKDIAPKETKKLSKWIVSVACLSVLLLALAGLNVYQYMSAQSNAEKVTELNAKISEKETEIKNRKSEISTLKSKASSLEEAAKNYETIVDTAKYGNLGYASSNFRSSESVIVVGRNEKNRKFTLITNWSGGGTVSVDYDSIIPSARVEFDQDNWDTSTKMTVQPKLPGVTVVTFSNDVDRQTFDIIIIVE